MWIPVEADEIREEANALNPKLNFVMADRVWIELRALTEKKEEFLERLQKRRVKFRELSAKCLDRLMIKIKTSRRNLT
jgi:hypothetical protein